MKSACQKNVYVLLLHFLTLSHFVTGDSGFRIGCTANETNGTVVVEWVKESVQFTTEVIGSKWLRLCVADTSKSRERETFLIYGFWSVFKLLFALGNEHDLLNYLAQIRS